MSRNDWGEQGMVIGQVLLFAEPALLARIKAT
jgi:hypothetical protein